eukprot:TRINITY_DN7483_c0_g1_i1.p1 TRINITY_DN7483_c0_g1~~TRINITY_DN7483_c0_g1_i1.p1  ORF type:complete len:329 (-),score=10.07 TRINITY_DN7483_c0_g1_i1:54-1040(-)
MKGSFTPQSETTNAHADTERPHSPTEELQNAGLTELMDTHNMFRTFVLSGCHLKEKTDQAEAESDPPLESPEEMQQIRLEEEKKVQEQKEKQRQRQRRYRLNIKLRQQRQERSQLEEQRRMEYESRLHGPKLLSGVQPSPRAQLYLPYYRPPHDHFSSMDSLQESYPSSPSNILRSLPSSPHSSPRSARVGELGCVARSTSLPSDSLSSRSYASGSGIRLNQSLGTYEPDNSNFEQRESLAQCIDLAEQNTHYLPASASSQRPLSQYPVLPPYKISRTASDSSHIYIHREPGRSIGNDLPSLQQLLETIASADPPHYAHSSVFPSSVH